MTREELIALIQAQKETKVAEVAANFDALIGAVQTLELSPAKAAGEA